MARNFAVITVRSRVVRLLLVLLACAAFVAGVSVVFSNVAVHRQPRHFLAKDGAFLRGAERLLLRLVSWQPERPGEVPWRAPLEPTPLDVDFARIRAAGFNGVRAWGALTPEQLAAAQRHELYVLQGVGLDPHTRFSDAGERERELARISRVVQNTRGFRNVLGYLLLTEPSAKHVQNEGLDNTRLFLREAARAVRRWDPGALVGFASGPGLEALDEPTLDFVALNLTPERATSLSSALGYAGLLRLWRERLSGKRPFLLSEYGVSVLPPDGAPMPGRYSEEEQAEILPALADAALRAGAAGSVLSSWTDGWWKNGEAKDDEQSHDALDASEWTGLVAFENLEDRVGKGRPAAAAMTAYHRAMVTRPVDGPSDERIIPIEAHITIGEEVQLAVEHDGQPAVVLPTLRRGAWATARFELPSDSQGPQRLIVSVRRGEEILARSQRLVYPATALPSVKLELVGRGAVRTVVARVLDAEGAPVPRADLRIGTLEASGSYDRTLLLRTDSDGLARGQVWLPPAPAQMLIVGGFMPPEGDTPWAYDSLFVTGEAS